MLPALTKIGVDLHLGPQLDWLDTRHQRTVPQAHLASGAPPTPGHKPHTNDVGLRSGAIDDNPVPWERAVSLSISKLAWLPCPTHAGRCQPRGLPYVGKAQIRLI
jgi:hypothetical protein